MSASASRVARPSGSATIEIDSSTPTIGTPIATANPSPIAGPTDRAPGAATASAPRGATSSSDAAEQEARHRRGDPEHDAPDRRRGRPSANRVAGAVDVARDRRCARRSSGGSLDTTSPPTEPDSVTTTRPFERGDVAVHPSVDGHVAVERDHPVVHDARRSARRRRRSAPARPTRRCATSTLPVITIWLSRSVARRFAASVPATRRAPRAPRHEHERGSD